MANDSNPFQLPDTPCAETLRTVPQETRALVDGVGVYTASQTSPFLTAPSVSSTDAVISRGLNIGEPDVVGDQLRDLREPLRRQMQAFPLRLRLSEDELSGLVSAVLDLISRHLPFARDRAHGTAHG